MRDNEEAVCGFGFGDEYAKGGMVKAVLRPGEFWYIAWKFSTW